VGVLVTGVECGDGGKITTELPLLPQAESSAQDKIKPQSRRIGNLVRKIAER
jgi:hypothetical protein